MEEKESRLEWTNGEEKNSTRCILYVDPREGVAGVRFEPIDAADGSGRFQVPLKDLVELVKKAL